MPANERPPLGKGPTGKDNPKIYDGNSSQLGFHSSRESSFAESPVSRSSSLPPEHSTTVISRPIQVIEGNTWNNTPLVNDQQQPEVSGKADMYQLMHMPTPSPAVKALSFSTYNHSHASSSRHSLPNNFFNSSPNSFSHSYNKSLPNNYNNQAPTARSNMCDDLSGQQYPFSQTSFQGHDVNMHSQSPPPNGHPLHPCPRNDSTQRNSPAPYLPHRRCATEPQGFSIGQGFPHLPMSETQQNMQQNDFANPQNGAGQLPALSGAVYGPDGQLNHA